MHFFRTTLHGHRVEFRLSDFGGESIIIDGREVSSNPLNWFGKGHFFPLTDEDGRARHIEMRRQSKKFTYEVIVSVDGQPRAILKPETGPPGVLSLCRNCGYDLAGLEEINGERRCPECGRHTSV
ncbi:MAG: hypothetical protein IT436_00690 [Phycisphaerales bacterium]|nr:hypothetical protein [Phycisphaerales bacterium]